jgi:hypothetical protein
LKCEKNLEELSALYRLAILEDLSEIAEQYPSLGRRRQAAI